MISETGELILNPNDLEKLRIMDTFGAAIMIMPQITDDGELKGNGVFCAMCQPDEYILPVPFMICNCLKWDCIKDAVREHVEFHVDKILTVREN